jgi:hypothetical protein
MDNFIHCRLLDGIEFAGLKGGWNTGADLHYLLTI